MNKEVQIRDMIPLMKEQLDAGKTVSFVPRGNSMKPMLDDGTDMIMLTKPRSRLKLLDVALYYRRETDSYVVHRLVGFSADGSYVMLGDHNLAREYNIRHEDVIGVLTCYYHKGKMHKVESLSYRLYSHFWFFAYPFRYFFRVVKAHIRGKN